MKEIKKKIQELLALNADNDYKNFEDRYNKQEKFFGELTALARKNKTLVGRILKFGVADGYAAYVILKENKKTVKVHWIDYVDGYCQWGLGDGESNILKSQAQASCNFEDYMDSRKIKSEPLKSWYEIESANFDEQDFNGA